jgi:hypothetical protein
MADSAAAELLPTDNTLYLYTSLTAGSSHIITATSRLETILKANRIPFRAVDVATDEKARRIWGRRAGKRKLPGLVKDEMVVGVSSIIGTRSPWLTHAMSKSRISTRLRSGMSTAS